MKRRKWLKTTSAMLAAASMLMSNAQAAVACPQDWFCWGQNEVVQEEVILEDSNSSGDVIGESENILVEDDQNTSQEELVLNDEENEASVNDNASEEIVVTEGNNENDSDEQVSGDEIELVSGDSEEISGEETDVDVNAEDAEGAEEAAAEETMPVSTFLQDGGSYSVGYILNNYNLFIQNSIIDTNHTMGPIASGGDAEITYWGMRGVVFDANSYIRGALTQNAWYASVGGGVLYLGTVNEGKYEWRATNYEDDDFGGCYVNVETGKGIHNTRALLYSDEYIDFDAAFDSIKSDIAGLDVDYVIDRENATDFYSIDSDKTATTLNIRAGSTYSIDSLQGISNINIFGSDVQSAVDTILIVDSSDEITMFPDVKVNGTIEESAEYGKNSSIVFIMPNATDITMRSSHAHFGHIIAPNAFVRFPGGGDYNGCVISKDFSSERHEGHMWPYNGKKFEGAATGFKVVKTVDGQTPSEDEVFNFTLEEAKNGEWTEIQTVSNNGSDAAFDTIPYALTDEGTHYYRVTESGEKSGYNKDESVYIVKVDIENVQSKYVVNQNKTESYYKVDESFAADECGIKCNDGNRVDAITFDNKKIEEPEEPTGEIEVTKVYVDKYGKAVKDDTTFYVVLSSTTGYCWWKKTVYYDLNGNEYSCVKVVPIKGGETVTYKNLTLGVSYTVTETDACGNTLCSNDKYEVAKGSETVCLKATKCSSSVVKKVEIKNIKKSCCIIYNPCTPCKPCTPCTPCKPATSCTTNTSCWSWSNCYSLCGYNWGCH